MANCEGRGIENSFAYLELTNCTIANNTKDLSWGGDGGGIYTDYAVTRLRNTIVANNDLGDLTEYYLNDSDAIVSYGNNLTSDDGRGRLNQPGDKINTN